MIRNVGQASLGSRIANADLGSVVIGGALFVFMASVFFGDIMPKSNTVLCAAVALADFAAVLRLIRNNHRFSLLPPGVLALLFLGFILVNQSVSLVNGADGYWLLRFGLCFAAAVLLIADSVDWLIFVAKLLAVFGLIHAIFTILFLVFPNLYTGWFKPHFFPSTLTAVGYKSGLCGHYSTNGMYLAWGLIASFYFWQTSGKREKKKWQVVAILILVALLLTTKRAHLIFGIASCLTVYMMLNNGKGSVGTALKLALFLAVALIAFYLASLFVPEIAKVVDRLNGAELDEGRSDYYAICLELFQSSPFVGHGWESFTTALYQSGIADLRRLYLSGNLHQNAHNVYFQLLAEEGLVGFLLFLSFALTSLILAVRTARSSFSPIGKLCALSLGVQVFFLLYCITGNPLYDIAEYSVYMMLGTAPFLAQPFLSDGDQSLD